MSARRHFRLLAVRAGDPRASVVAFLLQLTLILIVVPALVVPVAFEFLRDDAGRIVMPERISYITSVPDAGPRSREVPRAGGDGRVASSEPAPVRESAPVVEAPLRVPMDLPPTSVRPADPVTGVGPLVGGGGPTLGIRPSFTDRRLWQAPSDLIMAPMIPMTRADTLRAILQETAQAFVDSVSRATPAGGRQPGDWTFERNGKKYGIDPAFIRLGNFSIPTAVLALLPMNVQANPTVADRARRLSSMRSEILEQSARMERDDEFRSAVRALRERKERERREAEEKKRAAELPIPVRP